MTDRIFEDARSWEVSGDGREVEVYVLDPETSDRDRGKVTITLSVNAGWDSQRTNFTMTAEEATAMKNFLIKQGY